MAYTPLSSATPNLNQRLVALGFPLGALSLRVQLQLADRLRVAGFVVRSVQREAVHGVWSVKMLAGNAADAHDLLAVRRQVRQALREIGIRLGNKDVTVSFSGPLLVKVSFIHASGSSGLVTFSADGRKLKLGARQKQTTRRRRGATENPPGAEIIRPLWAARFPQPATRGVDTPPPSLLNDNYAG